MASKSVPKKRSKSASAPASSRRRASQRARGISIELGYGGKLRPMMIEHSRTLGGEYLTVYAGARGEFLATGIPAELIPAEGAMQFEIRHGSELLPATMSSVAGRLELEIDWGYRQPRDCGHHAVCEIARMILIELGDWTTDYGRRQAIVDDPDLEHTIRKLTVHEQTDYVRGPARLQISREFFDQLKTLARHAYEIVHKYGEVFPAAASAGEIKPKSSPIRLIVDNSPSAVRL